MKQRLSLSWMLKRVRVHIPKLLLMVLANVGHALLGVVFALTTRQVIDTAVSGSRTQFLEACLVQLAIIAGVILLQTLYRHLRDRVHAELDRSWKQHFLHVFLHGDYSAVSAWHSGELINRITNDVRVLNDGLTNAIPGFAAMLARLIGAMGVLLVVDPMLSLGILGVGLLVLVITALLRRRLKELHKRVSEADGKASGFVQEILENLLVVQAMDASKEMERRANKVLNERFEAQRKRKNVSLAANAGVSVFSNLVNFAALVWCAYSLLLGNLTFGGLTAIVQLVGQLRAPLVNLSGIFPQYIAMTAAAERLIELDALQEQREPESLEPSPMYEEMDTIEAAGLYFSYDRAPVFENAGFVLPKGSFSVITGPSGEGKSTILKLLMGIYRAEKGEICLRCEARSVPLDRSTRRLFAYVPQGNLLFSGTLRENLLISNPDADESMIHTAIYVSAMDAYLPQLPDGLDTVLGENGVGLSEGQAQRLAIARAVLGGAPILLLDEATSALDAETERLVLDRIRDLPDRTCIAVTHRPAALELADWNLDLRDRQITARPGGNA